MRHPLLTVPVLLMTTAALAAAPDVADRLRNHLAPHPRLLLGTTDPRTLPARLAAHPRLKRIYDEMIADADRSIDQPVLERIVEGRRLLTVSRRGMRRVTTLAFAYRATGDKRYFERCRTELLSLCAFKDFNPSHFLDTAETAATLGIGYDWLFDDLSPDERATLRRAIVDKCFAPSLVDPAPGWTTTTTNWNAVCNGGLAIAALAVAEDEGDVARRIVERSVAGMPRNLDGYGPDGAYPEGPGYWSYGTSYAALTLACLESALGSDFGLGDTPGFLASSDFYLHTTGPTGLFFNYADCGPSAGGPAAPQFYMAARRHEPAVLFNDYARMDAAAAAGKPPAGDRFAFALLLWALSCGDAAPAPTALHFVGHGETPVACHRTAWDRQATFVGIKAGTPSSSHAHMDVGAFVVDALGTRWAADLGVQEYNGLEQNHVDLWNSTQHSGRWQVFRIGPMSHNVLTIDGQEQVVGGHATIERSTAAFTVVDTGPVYAGQLAAARRGIRLNDDGSVRVQDEIAAPSDRTVKVRWAMTTQAKPEAQADGSMLLSRDDKTLRLRVVSPAGAKLVVLTQDPQPSPIDAANPGVWQVGFYVDPAAGSSATLCIDLQPGAPATEPAAVMPLDAWK